jgi:hypothetical protein
MIRPLTMGMRPIKCMTKETAPPLSWLNVSSYHAGELQSQRDGRPFFMTTVDGPRRQLLRVELTTVGSNQLK